MAESSKTPTKIGSYDIRRLLGSGPMGDVYQGTVLDPRTKTPVYYAIRLLNPRTAIRLDYLARFKSEIRDDTLLEYKEAEYDPTYQYYFVTDYLEIKPVSRQVLKRERSSDILDLFAKVCGGLQKAHQKNYIHGNIKTSNFLIRRGEEQVAQPILADYGLGYVYDAGFFTGDRFENAFPYMAPEKIEELTANVEPKDSKLTAAADTYSLTGVLVEALTGSRPFSGEGSVERVLQAKREHRYLLLHVNYPVCRVNIQRLNDVIRKGLSYDVGARFGSAAELASALTACKSGESKP